MVPAVLRPWRQYPCELARFLLPIPWANDGPTFKRFTQRWVLGNAADVFFGPSHGNRESDHLRVLLVGWVYAMASHAKQRLVVVGNGMAPGRALERLFETAPDTYDVTIFNAEPRVNYDRIMLSPVLSGDKSFEEIVIHGDGCATVPIVGPELPAEAATKAPASAAKRKASSTGSRKLLVVPLIE